MVNYSATGHWVRTHFQIEIPCHEGIGDAQMRELIQKALENLEKANGNAFAKVRFFNPCHERAGNLSCQSCY